MRYLLLFLLGCSAAFSSAQKAPSEKFNTDSLFIISPDPAKGFRHTYLLFIPKGTALHSKTVLLVEPNNTGKLSDSIALHQRYAIDLATVSSVGNNIATELHIPLLVPVFPRPASDSLIYTHALDRDVMLEQRPDLKRLDLQLLAMIEDAQARLKKMQVETDPKVFMNGFSASGSFTNRFSFIHPEKIKALAIGGFNGELMLPQTDIHAVALDYPLGIHDFKALFGSDFKLEQYRAIPQFIYMGKLDENDAVLYDDAYNENERRIIQQHKGKTVQERYLNCQKMYQDKNISPIFKRYEGVGHWTTSAVNLDVILFFLEQMKRK